MKLIKNNAKKLLSIAALAALTLCGVAQGVIMDVSEINEQTIVTVYEHNLNNLFFGKNYSQPPYKNPMDPIYKNPIKIKLAQTIAKSVTKANICKVDPKTIAYLLDFDISLAQTFASYITKDNFHELKIFVDNFAREFYSLIDVLLKADKNLAQKFTEYITKDNIENLSYVCVYSLCKEDPQKAQAIANVITKDNFHKIYILTIKSLMQFDKSLIKTFTQYITKDNIHKTDPISIHYLLYADMSPSKTFSVVHHLIQCITKDNIHKISLATISDLLADKTLAQTLASRVTKESFYKNPSIIKELLDTDYKISHLLAQFIPKSNLGLDHFIWNTQLLSNILRIQAHVQLKSLQQLSSQKTTRSHQHFATTYGAVLDMFSFSLKQDPHLSETLFKVVAREELELQSGRYTIAHGRRSNRFVRDQVWTWLKEIESKQPIARTSWYPMHWKTNGTSMPYKNVSEVIKHGRGSTEDRKSVQFASDLFGCKRGSSALDYVLRNKNVDNLSTQETIEELFEYFGREKYCKLGAEYFADAEELAATMKYGTLLLYSFTPEALERFAFVTHKSGAGKADITLLTPDGKEFDTSSPKKVLDTLLHNPNSFKDQSKNHEYVIAVCDDDTKDKTKLGTQNPFNQELRTYHFNFGKDQQLASEIKRLVAAGFMQIIPAMIKDKEITKELACELVKANPLFKQKSRL